MTWHRDQSDLLGLSVWLADTIVGPLTKGNGYTPIGAPRRLTATLFHEG